jgi:hypothetical protein
MQSAKDGKAKDGKETKIRINDALRKKLSSFNLWRYLSWNLI